MRLLSNLVTLGAALASCQSEGSIVDDSPLVVVYYENWAGWIREFSPSTLANNILSRNMPVRNFVLNYSFFTWNPTECSVQPVDTVDLQKGDHGAWTPDDWNIASQEQWATDKPIGGHLPAFMSLKAQYPYIKLLPSIGGWSRSGTFHECLMKKMDHMVDSLVDFVTVWGWDGADFDWEYPNCDGKPCGCQNESVCPNGSNLNNKAGTGDWERYKTFVEKVRVAFNKLESHVGRKLYITAALGMNPKLIDGGNDTWSVGTPIEWICDNDYFDWVNLMTYDFYGPWAPTTGPLAPLYPNTETSAAQMSIDESVQKMIARCSKPYKLTMGLATYGKSWSQVPKEGSVPGLWQEATGSPLTAGGTWELGTLSWFDIKKNLLPVCTRTWDAVSKTPTLFCDSLPNANDIPHDPNSGKVQRGQKNVFVTYEDGESWKAKMAYARANGMAGAIIWAASDTGNGKSYAPDSTDDLFNGLFQGWFGNDTVAAGKPSGKGTKPSFGGRWDAYPCPLSIDYVKDGLKTLDTDRCHGKTYSPSEKYLTYSGTKVSDVGKNKVLIHAYGAEPTSAPQTTTHQPRTTVAPTTRTRTTVAPTTHTRTTVAPTTHTRTTVAPTTHTRTTVAPTTHTRTTVAPTTHTHTTVAPTIQTRTTVASTTEKHTTTHHQTTAPSTTTVTHWTGKTTVVPRPSDSTSVTSTTVRATTKTKTTTASSPRPVPAWDVKALYDTPCQEVSYEGIIYKNGWYTIGDRPSSSDAYGVWRPIGSSTMHYQCR